MNIIFCKNAADTKFFVGDIAHIILKLALSTPIVAYTHTLLIKGKSHIYPLVAIATKETRTDSSKGKPHI